MININRVARGTRIKRELQAFVGARDVQKYEWLQELAWINRLPWRLRRLFVTRNAATRPSTATLIKGVDPIRSGEAP